jgi:hypothetical protein
MKVAFPMSFVRMLFGKQYSEEEKALRASTETTYDGRTIVKADVLLASEEFRKAEEAPRETCKSAACSRSIWRHQSPLDAMESSHSPLIGRIPLSQTLPLFPHPTSEIR